MKWIRRLWRWTVVHRYTCRPLRNSPGIKMYEYGPYTWIGARWKQMEICDRDDWAETWLRETK